MTSAITGRRRPRVVSNAHRFRPRHARPRPGDPCGIGNTEQPGTARRARRHGLPAGADRRARPLPARRRRRLPGRQEADLGQGGPGPAGRLGRPPKEKIADYLRAPGVTVRGALDKVPDAVRFTLEYEPNRYADGVLADVDRLKTEGFELLKLKNLWHADQYKGINSQWRRRDTGMRLEVQFHTPESHEAKELTHQAYERIRSNTASPAEERRLEEFQRRVNAYLAAPPGTNRIKDFPE
jgi:hypothetical protein